MTLSETKPLHRVHNFNAGPSAMPISALELAQRELLDFAGTGMSILEHSHRGAEYDAVHREVLGSIRRLLAVPESHEVLLLQGGAHMQFAMVPMNLLRTDGFADYVITGGWSEKALEEAQIVGNASVAATTAEIGEEGTTVYRRIPRQGELTFRKGAAYVHITTNNTLYGTQWHHVPEMPSGVPLVADMCSDFLSRTFDVSNYGLVYAGAQKNLGPAGLTVVVVAKDLIARSRTDIPKVLRYATFAKEQSLYNTPPTLAIYLARNVLRWIDEVGGMPAIESRNAKKAATLYAALDEMSSFYRAPVERASRSVMNVIFRLPTPALEDAFVSSAKKHDLIGLKGHRSTGGIRASLYNAVSPESVDVLVEFMRTFAAKNG